MKLFTTPNFRGRAHLSDSDFVVTREEKVEKFGEAEILKELEHFPFSEAQSHFMRRKSLHSLGYMNPLVLLVTKEHLVLRVYRSLFSKNLQRDVFFEEYYF